MDKLVIEGGVKLKGEVEISGSKNSALPIMAATLLTDDTCVIRNVPVLRDTQTMIKLLQSLGKNVEWVDDVLTVSSAGRLKCFADYDLVSTMRGSFCVLGPILAKCKKAKVSLPGGCVIGIRPVDLHLKGLKLLGAKIRFDKGYVIATCKQLQGKYIYLGGGFGSSVLATANIMMASCLAEGVSIIESAACEPEIVDLANMLNKMGAKIKGQGSPRLTIIGVKELKGIDYAIIPDRIEMGTYIMMAVATRSRITIKGGDLSHLGALVDVLNNVGVKIEETAKGVVDVKGIQIIKPVNITTYPYPGFPTDLQAQFLALMSLSEGVSVVADKVYPDRFIHVAELNRMGANIHREGGRAIVEGVASLYGAPVMASDLRASAALVIAGLAAKDVTEVHRIYHLERGYEKLEEKLKGLGAKVHKDKV